MDLKLRVLEGKNAGKEISVQGTKFFIGRAEDCHLRPGSDLISRHHCVILIEDGYIGVRDFGSKNGTFVNQERVVGERELKAGDQLMVGPLQFEVHVAHGLAAKKRPPVSDLKEALARTAQDAAHDPTDVTQWLNNNDDDTTARPAHREETMISARDTEPIPVASTETITHAMPVEEETHKGKPEKKAPGKLPQIPSSTKDSKDAAAAALNKFRKRR